MFCFEMMLICALNISRHYSISST